MGISSPISDDAAMKQNSKAWRLLRRSYEQRLCYDIHISVLASYSGSDGGYLMGNGTTSMMSGGR